MRPDSQLQIETDINPVIYVRWITDLLRLFYSPVSDTNDRNFFRMLSLDPSKRPVIPLQDFVQRINDWHDGDAQSYRKKHVTSPFIIAALLIVRYFQMTGRKVDDFELQYPHKLIVAAFLIGAKITYDRVFTQTYYAQVFGVTVEELNFLELQLLLGLQFNVKCSAGDFRDSNQGYQYCKAAPIPDQKLGLSSSRLYRTSSIRTCSMQSSDAEPEGGLSAKVRELHS